MDDRTGAGGGGIRSLVSILADGEEQARQLGARLGEPPAPDGDGDADDLRLRARRLQGTLGKAIAVARSIEAAAAPYDSPRSADESEGRAPRERERDAAQERHDMSKRRKGLPRWTRQIRVPDPNLEATLEDDFSWRKYGQKDILGAKFPRGYYRCTYRNAQGCLATKQVQRSDSDLCVFDVTYQGAHTCHQKQHRHSPAAAAQHDDGSQQPPAPPQDPSHQLELLASLKNGLKVETQGLSSAPTTTASTLSFHDHSHAAADAAAGVFSFPSVAALDGATAAAFSPVESGQQLGGGGFSPASFVSPAATSAGSSYFSSVQRCPAASFDYDQAGGVGARVVDSSELGEVVSAATGSAPADPAGFGYSQLYRRHYADDDQFGFDPHLPFPPMFGHPPQTHGQYRNT